MMGSKRIGIRKPVRRDRAETYILISLIAFAVTVIVTRVFLQLTGFPQIGNSVLHIAHALWGGLLLIVASYLPLAYANRWALQASAVLSGLGIGLFIDEVGKFITQTNDYFFPPALPLIYGSFLLIVLVYLYFRQVPKQSPQSVMYHVLEGLQDVLDGDVDAKKVARLENHLAIARESERTAIVSLADVLGNYIQAEQEHLSAGEPGFWSRVILRIDAAGSRLGRRSHRVIISVALVGWVALVTGYVATILQGSPNLDPQVLEWRVPLAGIQVVIGILMVVAAVFWLLQREELALKFGISGFLISLIALQLHYFYISQFSAITATLLQFILLQILFAYRRLYLSGETQSGHKLIGSEKSE